MKRSEKKHVKNIKIFLKKKKTKSANILVIDIEIFLKKKKKRSINMVVKDIRIFWRISIENIFLEFRKRDSIVKNIFYYIYPRLVHRLKNVLEYKSIFQKSIRNLLRLGVFRKDEINFFQGVFFYFSSLNQKLRQVTPLTVIACLYSLV